MNLLDQLVGAGGVAQETEIMKGREGGCDGGEERVEVGDAVLVEGQGVQFG
jgi:hypothetical protein